MKPTDFGDKLSDLADALENAHAAIEEALDCWDSEEMDEEQKAIIRSYLSSIEGLQCQLAKDQADNQDAIQGEDAVNADGEEEA